MQACEWAKEHFGSARLGDLRRTRRLVDCMTRMKELPGESLPAMMRDPAALSALYHLVDQEAVTHKAVLEPHTTNTLKKAAQQKQHTVLIIQDATELEFTDRKVAHEMGPIGCGKNQRGYLAHHALAQVYETGEILGLASQILYTRLEQEPKENKHQRAQNPKRQSLLWSRTSKAIGKAPPECRWIEVCDREADNFEYLENAQNPFVVRSKTNRRVYVPDQRVAPHAIDLEKADFQECKLHDWIRTLPAVETRVVEVRAQPQKIYRDGRPPRAAQKARLAPCRISWGWVLLRAPDSAGNRHSDQPMWVWTVRIWEIDPPLAPVEPLEWILLSDVPCQTNADALEKIDWYECRPVVEDLHKGEKTGCKIEDPQFTRAHRLKPILAMLSVLAVSLLEIRQAGRNPEQKTKEAQSVVSPVWVMLLSLWRWPKETPRQRMSVEEFYLALARLGGHQNRKGDGAPGWITLWRGFRLLMQRVQTYYSLQRLANRSRDPTREASETGDLTPENLDQLFSLDSDGNCS